MKFRNIEINNFRQYYGSTSIDLFTDDTRNIILIGGRNGYGKTNLLLSIVWCLYGDKIAQVDDNFKKEIQKERNFASFMQQSLNWTAKAENKSSFSVSLLVDDIEMPDLKRLSSNADRIQIIRKFDVDKMQENLSIIDPISGLEIFEELEDKINFINDFIIPIDAAKFVFFDAEKISEIANLSIKEEGSFINDALGKILGLDIYESLIEDLNQFINALRKEGATRNLQEQIIDREKAIELANNEIEILEEENGEHSKGIDQLKKTIREFDRLISINSKQGSAVVDRDAILYEIEKLKEQEIQLGERFNELSEIIPLAILAGKLEEVNEHLAIQNHNESTLSITKENANKIEEFIELLFNKPPEPENSSFSFKDKLFYYDKAHSLAQEIFGNHDEFQEISFEHDLNNADKKLIKDAILLVNVQSKELIESTIEEFNQVKLQITELQKKLNKVDADMEDDIFLEYTSKKETAEFQIAENNIKIGENNQQISKLKKDILRLSQEHKGLINKVNINNQNKIKIDEAQKYIAVLNEFLEEQKNHHKKSLEKNILNELHRMMHKLSSDKNDRKFIEDVKVTILASGQGMKISLYDQDDIEIRKESLSSGEKQIYISCLIKAILNESVQELPIFIDTPLGRLDEEHRDNITTLYYPELSRQVVLFSTNSEITPKRYRDISKFVARSYLLQNDGMNTTLKQGYFNLTSYD